MRNTIESGEEMYFADKEIHFDNGLSVEGKAVYENCHIFCNETDSSGSIEIEEGGELEFINCELICCGKVSNKNNRVFCFVKSDNGSLTIKNCKIQNFLNFAAGCFQHLEVSDSEFNDCAGGLFDADTDEKGTITNSKFICRMLPDFIDKYYENEASRMLNFAVMVLFLCDEAVQKHSVLGRGEPPQFPDDLKQLLLAERSAPDQHLDHRQQLTVPEEVVNVYRVALSAAVIIQLCMSCKLPVFGKEAAYFTNITRNAFCGHTELVGKL